MMLDPLASIMNHDCEPNPFVIYERNELRVRSQRPIASGEEITIAYVSPDDMLLKRMAALLTMYFFRCQCKSHLHGKCVKENGILLHITGWSRGRARLLGSSRAMGSNFRISLDGPS